MRSSWSGQRRWAQFRSSINFMNRSVPDDSGNSLDASSEGSETRCHEQSRSRSSQARRPVTEHAALLQPFHTAHTVRRGLAGAGLGTDRHTRSVDGRDFHQALGLSLGGLSELMIALGCYRAVNLDGGSSKRMVVQGKTVDHSSTEVQDGSSEGSQQRPVRTALFFSAR